MLAKTLTRLILVLVDSAAIAQPPSSFPAESRLDARMRVRRAVATHVQAVREGKLPPVVVGDTILSADHVKREVVFALGGRLAQLAMVDFFLQDEIARQLDMGRPREQVALDEEAADEVLASRAERLARRRARQCDLVERVFLPGHPNDWPEVTKRSVAGSTHDFWDNLVSGYEKGEWKVEGLSSFWLDWIRLRVIDQLEKEADVAYPSSGLPLGLAMRVDDFEWPTSEAFDMVRDYAHVDDLERALTMVVMEAALRHALVGAERWLDDDEFRDGFEAFNKDATLFPYSVTVNSLSVEIIATGCESFPTVESFRRFWRIAHAFESANKNVDEAQLAEHAAERASLFRRGTVSVELVPFLARDPETSAWRPGGLAAAERAVIAAYRRLEEGASFEEVRVAVSDFGPRDKSGGVYEDQSMDELRMRLDEGTFTDVVLGFSLAEYLFFNAPEGKPVGPLPGPNGYYLALVTGRKPGSENVLALPGTQEWVAKDYARRRFYAWIDDVLMRTVIR